MSSAVRCKSELKYGLSLCDQGEGGQHREGNSRVVHSELGLSLFGFIHSDYWAICLYANDLKYPVSTGYLDGADENSSPKQVTFQNLALTP